MLLCLPIILMLVMGGDVVTARTAQTNHVRDSRFIAATVVTVEPHLCETNVSTNPFGYCYSKRDCEHLKGSPGAGCADIYGTCCYFERTCDEKTLTNMTGFVNPSFPGNTMVDAGCQLTVDLISNNICQLRLDFHQFVLTQPDSDGVCKNDTFTVKGVKHSAKIPKLCGDNSGQHMYVDVDPSGGPPLLQVEIVGQNFERSWNIHVTQIECNSKQLAPTGCLQYYTQQESEVRSFNYKKPTMDEIKAGNTNIHLANLNYAVCLASASDACSVTWTANEKDAPYSFVVSGDAIANVDNVGIPRLMEVHDNCPDHVAISSAMGDRDRFCGLVFRDQVKSEALPFMLRVVTDDKENGEDTANVGFSLKFKQENGC